MFKNLFSKKKTPVEKYMAHLDRVFQKEPEFYKEESTIDGISGVSTIVYRDFPEKGLTTGVTYGLSLVKHPDWKLGRPELMITVDSKDVSCTLVAGYLANKLRGNCPFSYGNTINFREKISNDSTMDAFFIFAPAAIKREDFLNIEIGLDYKISISGLYPIYASEIELINSFGLEKFWKHPAYDLYSVTRKVLFF